MLDPKSLKKGGKIRPKMGGHEYVYLGVDLPDGRMVFGYEVSGSWIATSVRPDAVKYYELVPNLPEVDKTYLYYPNGSPIANHNRFTVKYLDEEFGLAVGIWSDDNNIMQPWYGVVYRSDWGKLRESV